jgi:hypothetical protein
MQPVDAGLLGCFGAAKHDTFAATLASLLLTYADKLKGLQLVVGGAGAVTKLTLEEAGYTIIPEAKIVPAEFAALRCWAPDRRVEIGSRRSIWHWFSA